MRDKLIELIREMLAKCKHEDCYVCIIHGITDEQTNCIADHLIANGVTIREHGVWKPYYDHFRKGKQIGWICTNCSVVVKGFDTDYCPWCGAVMDDYEDDEPSKEEV